MEQTAKVHEDMLDKKNKIDDMQGQVTDTVETFRKDIEVLKTNIIATGQLPQNFSLDDGVQLKNTVTLLQSDFKTMDEDHRRGIQEVNEQSAKKMSSFRSETQMVFDSILKDIHTLQDQTK